MHSRATMYAARLAVVPLLCCVSAVSGCAARSGAPISPQSDRVSAQSYVISVEEIAQRNEATVGELVERLRPQWGTHPTRRRGPDTLLDWTFRDEGKRVTFLCAVEPCSNYGSLTPTNAVTRLEYVQPGTPVAHRGTVHEGGVILMYFAERSTAAK